MLALFAPFLLVSGGCENNHEPYCWGYLFAPNFCQDAPACGPAEPYFPEPGDIFLATDRGILARLGHKIAGADSVHHSGIVFAFPDGHPAILEAGPHNSLRVETMEVFDHLKSHEDKGEKVWIRRRAVPLTEEQSACLTAFALGQDGKRFAVVRLAGQFTPLRSRGPIRTRWLGGPHGERSSYFCSELVAECCVAAGLLDPRRTRPAATYPCDLYYGRSRNPYLDNHLDINACWFPPRRWASCVSFHSLHTCAIDEKKIRTEHDSLSFLSMEHEVVENIPKSSRPISFHWRAAS